MAKKRFKEGEIVHLTDGSYGKLVCGEGHLLFTANDAVFVEGATDSWYFRSELQKLTKTERGG